METRILRWLMNEYLRIRSNCDLEEAISYPGLSEEGCKLLFKLGKLCYESDFLHQLGFDFLLSGEASLSSYIKSCVRNDQSYQSTYQTVRRSILKASALLSKILSADQDNLSDIDLELKLISAESLHYDGLPALDRVYFYPFAMIDAAKGPIDREKARNLLTMLSSLRYKFLLMKIEMLPADYAGHFKYIHETSDEHLSDEDLALKEILRRDIEDVYKAK